MELTLWWVEEKDWDDAWKPAYGPYVDQYKAEEKARKIDSTSGGWLYREPTTRVRGITIKGEEAY
jgi:hypothetical protein